MEMSSSMTLAQRAQRDWRVDIAGACERAGRESRLPSNRAMRTTGFW